MRHPPRKLEFRKAPDDMVKKKEKHGTNSANEIELKHSAQPLATACQTPLKSRSGLAIFQGPNALATSKENTESEMRFNMVQYTQTLRA